jgi:hypothetical protein
VSFAEERINEIQQTYPHLIREMFVLTLGDERFRLLLRLRDGSTLRVMERWQDGRLLRYSYYWLDIRDNLKVGWDNAPHHTDLANYPHHRHVGAQSSREPSYETCLDDVMRVIEHTIAPPDL